MSSWRQAARGFRPRARQVPKTDASVILLSVPRSDRVPPLILRLITTWRRLRSAGLLSDGTSGSATKTKSSLMWRSMRRHSRPCRANRSSQEGLADGQQLPLPGQLSGAPWSCLRMGERPGLDIELMDCRGPLGQRGVLGVERHQVVDVPQQVRPAPLLRAIVMVVGSVEIADQYSGE